jgi:hypothetical protein
MKPFSLMCQATEDNWVLTVPDPKMDSWPGTPGNAGNEDDRMGGPGFQHGAAEDEDESYQREGERVLVEDSDTGESESCAPTMDTTDKERGGGCSGWRGSGPCSIWAKQGTSLQHTDSFYIAH